MYGVTSSSDLSTYGKGVSPEKWGSSFVLLKRNVKNAPLPPPNPPVAAEVLQLAVLNVISTATPATETSIFKSNYLICTLLKFSLRRITSLFPIVNLMGCSTALKRREEIFRRAPASQGQHEKIPRHSALF